MIQDSIINVLGAGKISFSALIPSTFDGADNYVLVATTNGSLNGICKCIFDNIPNMEYPIMYANNAINSLAIFCNDMEQANVRVGVIPTAHELFLEMIKNGNGGIWFSACREGLYVTYLPLMENYITKPTHIFVFDNDEAIVKKAKETCKNPYIHIHRCIIHSVCSSVRYDYINHAAYLTSGKECLLVFPPEVSEMKSLFKDDPLNGRTEFVFTDSESAFHFYELWKPICINALHTLAAVKAYHKGLSKEMTFQEISTRCFSDFISKDDMLSYILHIQSLLYDKHLAPYAESVQADKDTCAGVTIRFISSLYESQEIIGRGLDVNHSSFDSKLASHFPLLKSSEDFETINLLNAFEKALNIYK